MRGFLSCAGVRPPPLSTTLLRTPADHRLSRTESHPLRVHARDFKVCLLVFFVVCAVFLAAGILRSLGWGDEVIDEPAGPVVKWGRKGLVSGK